MSYADVKWGGNDQFISPRVLGCQRVLGNPRACRIDCASRHRNLTGDGSDGDIKHNRPLLIGQEYRFAGRFQNKPAMHTSREPEFDQSF